MPRKARIDAPGALHHIIIRGIERTAIFRDQIDCENFLQRLGRLLSESSTPCMAWALMGNHAHLLLRTGLLPISSLMRRLLTGYAQQYNRRHRRHGVLFQNRYKSILCEENSYLLELVRYIHLNPARAGVVKDIDELRDYDGSGHSALMGKIARSWQETDSVLRLFGGTVRQARKAYERFVAKGLDRGRRPELVGGGLIRSAGGWSALKAQQAKGMRIMGDERILGSGVFVESVLKKAQEKYERNTLLRMKGFDLGVLIERVTGQLGVSPAGVLSAGQPRKTARARALISALAVDCLGISGREVSLRMGLSPSAVSKQVQRGRRDELFEKWAELLFRSSNSGFPLA
jgi:REP element-mobilizing transposase RayT